MYWQITPYHTNDADYWVGPAETEADHRAALEYAQGRLEAAWDQLQPGMLASVTIELCKGDMPDVDDDETGKNPDGAQSRAGEAGANLGVRLGDLPTEEGWYVALPHTVDGQAEVVHVRIDEEKQDFVVDAAGQEARHSECLWRYKEWSWSKRLELPNVELRGRAL